MISTENVGLLYVTKAEESYGNEDNAENYIYKYQYHRQYKY